MQDVVTVMNGFLSGGHLPNARRSGMCDGTRFVVPTGLRQYGTYVEYVTYSVPWHVWRLGISVRRRPLGRTFGTSSMWLTPAASPPSIATATASPWWTPVCCAPNSLRCAKRVRSWQQRAADGRRFCPASPCRVRDDLDTALDDLTDALRDYSAAWNERLLAAPNHRGNWALVALTESSDDAQLEQWLLGDQTPVAP